MSEEERILIVDDNSDNLAVMKKVLQKALPDVDIVTCQHSEDAMDLLHTSHISLAILDVQMPGMNGIELSRLIKTTEETRHTHIILITSHDAASDLKVQGMEAGADDFLNRPMDNTELVARVKVALRISRAESILRCRASEMSNEIRQYSHIVSSSSDMMALLDKRFTYLTANKAYLNAFGLAPEQLVGNTVANVFGEKFFNAVIRPYAERCLRGEEVNYQDWFDYPVGGRCWMDMTYYPYYDDNDIIIGFAVNGRDISERKKSAAREKDLGEQLARAERMKSLGVLAGGVAHDLNNVLGPMVMLPEIIREDVEMLASNGDNGKADVLEALSVIKSSAERAAVVVRDLVALSRRGQYDREPTDINTLPCMEIDSNCANDIRRAHPEVSIKHKPTKGRLMVLAADDHLNRVVDNLMRNAAEAIEGRGIVTVAAYKKNIRDAYNGYVTVPSGDYAIIEVSDTGQGIKKEHLGRIFEPFFTRKKKSDRSGSGLGLSVVLGIIGDHDGFIDVSSVLDKGTTFTIYLPLIDDAAVPVESSEEKSVPRGTGRVLVVDDEPGQRFLARRGMSKLGYTVTEAEDGNEAVKLFTAAHETQETSPYDLVMLDMIMGDGFDGLETLNEILKLYPDQKIIIVSGHAEDDRSKAAQELGADWLAKPYNIDDLGRAARKTLDA